MNKLISYIKLILNPKKITPYLIIAAIMVFIVTRLMAQKPASDFPVINFNPTITYGVRPNFPNLTSLQSLPEEIMVYEYIESNKNNEEIINKVTQSLKLTEGPVRIDAVNESSIVWRNEKNDVLFYFPKQGRLEYNAETLLSTELFKETNPDKEKLIEAAQNFLVDNGLSTEKLLVDETNIRYLKKTDMGLEEVNTSTDEAHAIKIPFTYTMMEKAITSGNPQYNPINITLTANKTVIDLQYKFHTNNLKEFKNLKTKNKTEIEKDLYNKKAALVYVDYNTGAEGFSVSQIKVNKISIKNTEVVYYEPDEYQKYLQPVIMFRSECDVANVGDRDCTLMIPLVKR